MTTVMVAGALANKAHNGGAAWTRLSWALGLRELGFDVHVVEQLSPSVGPSDVRWGLGVLDRFGLGGSVTMLDRDGSSLRGLERERLAELASATALLINLSGHLMLRDVQERAAVTVYVDLDPGYTQLWHARGLLEILPHDHYLTVGLAVGSRTCTIPTAGLRWQPTPQPVLLGAWPSIEPAGNPDRFTTVAAWRGPFGTVEHGGQVLGPKAHQLRRFLPLPQRAPGRFELALDIHADDGKDKAALEEHGWDLVDPAAVSGSPEDFRTYVQRSGAEWSVAQGMYVDTGSGWVADRTTRYLASGRPVLVQDTGFGAAVPTGEGFLTFRTLDEAVDGARRILADPVAHGRAARSIAEQHFAASIVLGRMCEEVGVAP